MLTVIEGCNPCETLLPSLILLPFLRLEMRMATISTMLRVCSSRPCRNWVPLLPLLDVIDEYDYSTRDFCKLCWRQASSTVWDSRHLSRAQ